MYCGGMAPSGRSGKILEVSKGCHRAGTETRGASKAAARLHRKSVCSSAAGGTARHRCPLEVASPPSALPCPRKVRVPSCPAPLAAPGVD